MPHDTNLSLTAVDRTIEAFLDQAHRSFAGKTTTIHISPRNEFAESLIPNLQLQFGMGNVVHTSESYTIRASDAAPAGRKNAGASAYIVTEMEEHLLSKRLLSLGDIESGTVLFPKSGKDGLDYPLFLISIPKAGTHLLYQLADSLGYRRRVIHNGDPQPGGWYCVEGSNSHTKATDFFIDKTRDSVHGNRLHQFPSSPAIFLYRHPYDILCSEAEYYHKRDASPFWGYLKDLSFDQRVERLVDDRWLLGSLRDRIAGYVAWLDFPNVIPLSFEEIIGPQGDGDDALRRRTIWSLLLKLRLDGDVDQIAGTLFNRDSPTFHRARIGAHKTLLTPAAWEKADSLDHDYMAALGYSATPDGPAFSSRVKEFRERPLDIPISDAQKTPVLIEQDFYGWNLVKFEMHYYAVLVSEGDFDMRKLQKEEAGKYLNATSIGQLKRNILTSICAHPAK
ncbi:MAG: hypothetical protein H6842_11745 [Rhodospirillaceae bacterium]|nr:hypothetical protein [Rhodospirillaceae bacterium]